jgi:glycyl-tRNA synthetase beta chain
VISARLAAVRAFAALPEAPALAAANKRIGNILKKADGAVDPHVSEVLLQEDAEKALYAAMQRWCRRPMRSSRRVTTPARCRRWPRCGRRWMPSFDGVMVNAEQLDLRLNRLGLLRRALHTR